MVTCLITRLPRGGWWVDNTYAVKPNTIEMLTWEPEVLFREERREERWTAERTGDSREWTGTGDSREGQHVSSGVLDSLLGSLTRFPGSWSCSSLSLPPTKYAVSGLSTPYWAAAWIPLSRTLFPEQALWPSRPYLRGFRGFPSICPSLCAAESP